jgi:hypothetical protein
LISLGRLYDSAWWCTEAHVGKSLRPTFDLLDEVSRRKLVASLHQSRADFLPIFVEQWSSADDPDEVCLCLQPPQPHRFQPPLPALQRCPQLLRLFCTSDCDTSCFVVTSFRCDAPWHPVQIDDSEASDVPEWDLQGIDPAGLWCRGVACRFQSTVAGESCSMTSPQVKTQVWRRLAGSKFLFMFWVFQPHCAPMAWYDHLSLLARLPNAPKCARLGRCVVTVSCKSLL